MKKPIALGLLCVALLATGLAVIQARRLATEGLALDAERTRLEQLQQALAARQRAEAAEAATPPSSAAAEASVPAAISTEAAARETEMQSWYGKLRLLRESFTAHPDQRIPELSLLTDLDWLRLARTLPSTASETSLRQMRSAARNIATSQVIDLLGAALRGYVSTSNNLLPSDVAQLQPFLKTPLDPAVLARYQMRAQGAFPIRGPGAELIAERGPIDEDLDIRYTVSGGGGRSSAPWAQMFLRTAINDARRAFVAVNGDATTPRDSDLLPFVTHPEARPIMQAMADYRARHGRDPADIAALRPLVTDPVALARLDRMSASEAARKGR